MPFLFFSSRFISLDMAREPHAPKKRPQGAWFIGAALAAFTLLVQTPARAEPAQSSTETRWYGAPILIGMAASDALILAGVFNRSAASTPLAVMGLGGHIAVGPVVHWVNGEVRRGFASLGLNLGLPALGLVLARGSCWSRNDADHACETTQAQLALALGGAVIGATIDIGALAYKPASAPSPRWMSHNSFVIVPTASPRSVGLSVLGQL